MWVASVVLPTPPFWFSKAMITARPSLLESRFFFAERNAARRAVWQFSTETARCFY